MYFMFLVLLKVKIQIVTKILNVIRLILKKDNRK